MSKKLLRIKRNFWKIAATSTISVISASVLLNNFGTNTLVQAANNIEHSADVALIDKPIKIAAAIERSIEAAPPIGGAGGLQAGGSGTWRNN